MLIPATIEPIDTRRPIPGRVALHLLRGVVTTNLQMIKLLIFNGVTSRVRLNDPDELVVLLALIIFRGGHSKTTVTSVENVIRLKLHV